MKTKSKLWLWGCSLALCLGLMGIGVYSALSASVNINGMLGFNMHNAIVEVSGTISPIAQKDSSTNSFSPTSKEIKRTAMGGETQTTTNMDLGDLYFYAKEEMVFDFSFKNIGTIPITMSITINLGDNSDSISIAENINYIPFTDNTYENYILADDTKHVKFALKLNDTASEIEKNAFSINFSFAEAGVTLTNGYYEGIQYTIDNTTPITTSNSSANPSFLSSSVTPLSNKTIYTASVSGYNAAIPADAKIQPFISDGTNLYMVTSIGASAFNNCTSITSVTIPDSVVSIGSKAFSGSTGLTSVTIGSNVNKIGDNAFVENSTSWLPSHLNINKVNISSLESWCNIDFPDDKANPLSNELYLNNVKITDLKIPDGVTSIGQYAFNNFKVLTSVTIPNSVTSIGDYAFYKCSGLTGALTIPNSVISIGKSAFENCMGLTSVTIPDGVTSIGNYAFDYCSNLQWYTDPYDTSGALKYLGNESNKYIYLWGLTSKSLTTATINSNTKFIGSNVFNCTQITSVTIPDSVIRIGYSAFGNTTDFSFGSLRIKNVNISSLEAWCNIDFDNSMANPLYWGANLYLNGVKITDLTIPNSVKEIKNYAFYNCAGLTSVTIGNSVTSIGASAFENCMGLTSVTIGNSVTSIGDYAFCKCSDLAGALTLSNSVTSIGMNAFNGCSKLTSVTIPDGVTSIGNYAFDYCSNLQWYTDPNDTNGALKYLGNESNKYIYLWGLTSKSLTTATINSNTKFIGSKVFDCSQITSVTIPDSVIGIGSSAFGNTTTSSFGSLRIKNVNISSLEAWCNIDFDDSMANPLYWGANLYLNGVKITDLTIPNSVKEIKNYAFYNCAGLTSITFPNSLTSIGSSAFDGCSSLTGNLIIPNSVTNIGNYAFRNCSGLSGNLIIPDSVMSIGDSVFEGCSGFTGALTIPNRVTSIGNSAFRNCSGLSGNLIIPNSVTSIGNYAFYNCAYLTSVTFESTTPPTFDKPMFGSCNAFNGSGLKTIYVPNEAAVAAYSTDAYLSTLTGVEFKVKQ